MSKRPTSAKYVILVPTEYQKKKLEKAFELLHYLPCSCGRTMPDFPDDDHGGTLCQLAHEYLPNNSIVVDKKAYERLTIS